MATYPRGGCDFRRPSRVGVLIFFTLGAACATTHSNTPGPLVTVIGDPRALTPAPANSEEGKSVAAKARQLSKKSPRDRETLLAQARLALARRDAKDAEDHAKQVLAIDFRDRKAKLIMAHAALIAGRPDDAKSILDLLGGDKAVEGEVLNVLGLLAWDDGDPEAAERLFSGAVVAEPGNFASRLNLGLTYLRRGRLDPAETSFREAIKILPHNADARRHLGITLARKGKLGEAEDQYQSIEGWEKNARILHDLALVYRRAGRLDDAVDALGRALEIRKIPLAHHDSMVALLEEIRAERIARDPQDIEDVDAMIAQAKKGRPVGQEEEANNRVTGAGLDMTH